MAKQINLRSKPRQYVDGKLAATAAAQTDKGWLVRTTEAIAITPKTGLPTTLGPGYLICLPVDAGRLEAANLGQIVSNWS